MKQLLFKTLPKRPDPASVKDALIALTFFALTYIIMTGSAHAQTLGDMMCSISFNIAPFENLMSGLAYIAGGIFIGSGLLQMIKHHDMLGRSEHQLYKPIAHMVAGACLLAMPAFIRLSVASIFGFNPSVNAGGGLSSCLVDVNYDGVDHNQGMNGFDGGNLGLDGLMMNLIMNIKNPMVTMLSVLSVIIGVFLVFRGLVKGAKFGTDPRAHSVSNILASIIIGSILVTVGTSLNAVMTTVFGSSNIGDSHAVLSAITADFTGNTGPFQQGVYAALTFAQLIGMIAFIRGWLILKDAAEGQGQKTVAQGLTHIFGGVLAVNIYSFLEVLDNTFGTGFL